MSHSRSPHVVEGGKEGSKHEHAWHKLYRAYRIAEGHRCQRAMAGKCVVCRVGCSGVTWQVPQRCHEFPELHDMRVTLSAAHTCE